MISVERRRNSNRTDRTCGEPGLRAARWLRVGVPGLVSAIVIAVAPAVLAQSDGKGWGKSVSKSGSASAAATAPPLIEEPASEPSEPEVETSAVETPPVEAPPLDGEDPDALFDTESILQTLEDLRTGGVTRPGRAEGSVGGALSVEEGDTIDESLVSTEDVLKTLRDLERGTIGGGGGTSQPLPAPDRPTIVAAPPPPVRPAPPLVRPSPERPPETETRPVATTPRTNETAPPAPEPEPEQAGRSFDRAFQDRAGISLESDAPESDAPDATPEGPAASAQSSAAGGAVPDDTETETAAAPVETPSDDLLQIEPEPEPVDPTLIREAQRHLATLGYYPGGIDGRVGPMTEGGVRRFQQSLGLAVDGDLSPELVALMREEAATARAAAAAAEAEADSVKIEATLPETGDAIDVAIATDPQPQPEPTPPPPLGQEFDCMIGSWRGTLRARDNRGSTGRALGPLALQDATFTLRRAGDGVAGVGTLGRCGAGSLRFAGRLGQDHASLGLDGANEDGACPGSSVELICNANRPGTLRVTIRGEFYNFRGEMRR